MRCRILLPCLVTLVLLVPRSARAAAPPDESDKTLPCRPTIACTADLVPVGALEIEAGYLFRKIGPSERQWTYPFLLKLTLARFAQLQVGSNGLTVAHGDEGARYFDDATIGLKLHLVDQSEHVPSLALSATASVPTASDQRGYVPTWDASFLAYVTKDFGPLHADLNLGTSALRLEGAPQHQELAALALSAEIVRPFGAMAEAYYFSDAAPLAPRDGGFLFAVTHSPRAWLMFDAGGDVGFFPSTRAYSVFVGMSIVPAVLFGR